MLGVCWALAATSAAAAAAEPLAPDAEAAAAAACPRAFIHELAGPPLGCTEAERPEWLAHMKA
eukprot:COSAG04_NODE_32130_length_253_cov_0.597403_1_plen_62_part_10